MGVKTIFKLILSTKARIGEVYKTLPKTSSFNPLVTSRLIYIKFILAKIMFVIIASYLMASKYLRGQSPQLKVITRNNKGVLNKNSKIMMGMRTRVTYQSTMWGLVPFQIDVLCQILPHRNRSNNYVPMMASSHTSRQLLNFEYHLSTPIGQNYRNLILKINRIIRKIILIKCNTKSRQNCRI